MLLCSSDPGYAVCNIYIVFCISGHTVQYTVCSLIMKVTVATVKKMLPGKSSIVPSYFSDSDKHYHHNVSTKVWILSVLGEAIQFIARLFPSLSVWCGSFKSHCFQRQTFQQSASPQLVFFSPSLLHNYHHSPGFEWRLQGKIWKCVVSNYIPWAKVRNL